MIKNGDFIKLHYTGKLPDGRVFDTTNEAVAKASGLAGTRKQFHPIAVVVGERMLLPGLDESLVGKSPGKYTVTLPSEKAFGKKDPALQRIVPEQELRKQGIIAKPGLQLNIDGEYGVVRTAGAGRVVVDFNHPLADHDVSYEVEILGTVTDVKERVEAVLDAAGIPHTNVTATATSTTIRLPAMPPQPVLDAIHQRVTKLTGIHVVTFEQGTKPA